MVHLIVSLPACALLIALFAENVSGSRKRKARRDKARARQARAYRAERKMEGWVDWTKRAIFRPEIAGGVFAVGRYPLPSLSLCYK